MLHQFCGMRLQFQQGFKCVCSFGTGFQFHDLPEQTQGHNHTGRFIIHGNPMTGFGLHRDQGWKNRRHKTVNKCRQHSDTNQAPHVQVAGFIGNPATLNKRFSCPKDDGNRQHQFNPRLNMLRNKGMNMRTHGQCKDN